MPGKPAGPLMGNPADNPTGSVRDHYGPSLEPVGRWRGRLAGNEDLAAALITLGLHLR